MITLTVLTGPDAGSVFALESEVIVIGRSSVCDVMLHDAALGRRHCEIRHEGGNFILADLGSVNGTFLNEQQTRVKTHVLHNQDEISFGKSRIRVELPEREKEEEKPLSPTPSLAPPPPPPVNVPMAENGPRVPHPVAAAPQPEEATVIAAPSERSQPRILLRVIKGQDAGKVFEPQSGTKRFTVGRGQAADLTLEDRKISRIHFAVELTPTGFVLIDEGSLNGTFVNDKSEPVRRLELRGGEEIRLGETRLQVEIPLQGEATLFAPLPPPPVVSIQATPSAVREPPAPLVKPDEAPSAVTSTPGLPRFWAVFIITLLATASAAGFLALDKQTFFSSGPVSAGHAKWEGECATCHPPWGVQPVSATCGTADCHASELQANAQAQDNCVDCHTEHHGRSFNIKGDAAQCWRCHETSFAERPMWRYYKQVLVASGERSGGSLRWALPAGEERRRAWQQSAPQVESGLIFAHTAHAKASGQEDCQTCHQPLPGEVINALGVISAFPTHEECIDCHKEVVDRDPQIASASASPRCRKCHTREDGRITHVQRTLAYVQFSHDNHKATVCVQCHFTVTDERMYRPVLQSVLYPLPMDACTSCHEQQQATIACLDCHRVHHNIASEVRVDAGWLRYITLSRVLLVLLVLEAGVGTYAYFSLRPV